MSQLVDSPTHFSSNGLASTIDLLLATNPKTIKTCEVLPELLNSDHKGLLVSLKAQHSKEKVVTKRLWHYSSAEFDQAAELLDMSEWEAELSSFDIDSCVSSWQSIFLQVMEICIPHKYSIVKRNIPRLNREIARAIRKGILYFEV